MVNINDLFEDVFLKILNVCSNPDLLEVEYNNKGGIWIGYIYLDDNEDADDYDFTWEIGKPFKEQSQDTQKTLRLLCQ